MRFLNILFLCLLGIAECFSQSIEYVKQRSDVLPEHILVVAHRGDWKNEPENSLAAIKNCIDMGVDMVEIDLHMTKDSVLILLHDETLDRTTNGKGSPLNYSLEEIKKLYLKDSKGNLTGHKIPTLEEVFTLCKDKIMINIDKGYDYFKDVVELMNKFDMMKQCVIKSSVPYKQIELHYGNLLETVVYMPVINLNDINVQTDISQYWGSEKPKLVELIFNDETKFDNEVISELQEQGIRLFVNSLWADLCAGHHDEIAINRNMPDESWGWLLEHGVTVIQTDYPFELIKYLKSKGLRN